MERAGRSAADSFGARVAELGVLTMNTTYGQFYTPPLDTAPEIEPCSCGARSDEAHDPGCIAELPAEEAADTDAAGRRKVA
jgi:hypothetical protein